MDNLEGTSPPGAELGGMFSKEGGVQSPVMVSFGGTGPIEGQRPFSGHQLLLQQV